VLSAYAKGPCLRRPHLFAWVVFAAVLGTGCTAPTHPVPPHARAGTALPAATPTEVAMARPSYGPLTITILYNNIPSDPRLRTDWGFSALVERGGELLLFDAGANGTVFMENAAVLGMDPARVGRVVISHAHSDHTGGLEAFLEAARRPPTYLLPESGVSLLRCVRARTEVIGATPGMEITAGILTTGNVGGSIPEQSLVIRTHRGLVVITGCAHPGIVRIVERAVRLAGDSVYLVMGGFHLADMSEDQISSILRDFRRLGVRKVAPSHCTGERAIAMFAAEYGDDFLRTGAGSVIRVEE
jgi:7,8-dihydropterin-6-yl-methyl-4-(beta-D-ribofuranosyl)aminobenzene 5'-phosphate synthase